MKFKLLTLAVILIISASCKKKTNASNYTSKADCSTVNDTSNTYNKKIKNIINQNCSSCHNSGYSAGKINLDSYSNSKNVFLNGEGLCTVHHGTGCKPMPEGGSLSSSDIQLLDCWVKNGCKE